MHSDRSEHSHRRQHGDRGLRQWDDYDDYDDYDDRCKERWETHRDVPRDSYHQYGGDRHSSTDMTNKQREYSDSPKRRQRKDAMSRDWSRKSPVRGRASSPDWAAADKKRQRFAEDDEDDYRYRREPEDKMYRHSPDSFSHPHGRKDFEHTLPQEENFKYRKTSNDPRHQHRHKEFTHRQQHDDYRPQSGYYKDRDHHERSWDRSDERTRSRERSTKSCGKPREREDTPPTPQEDPRQTRTRFPLNEPSGQSFDSDVGKVTEQNSTAPEQKSTKGFQRFLDVLNKGVNVAVLTKIVTQTSPEVIDRPHSSASFLNTADRLWSPGSSENQHGSHQNNHHWSINKGSKRQPHHRSFSPMRRSLSDEKSVQRSDDKPSYHLNSRSRSPSVVGKKTLTPEDEHKHRQMQDVLQAIGMDLGSEELGQMSHRIQERLYGKRDRERGHHRGGSRERDTRRAVSPRHRSRSSSSSRSNFSSATRDSYRKKDSCSAQRDVTEGHQLHVHQAVEYGLNGCSGSSQDSVTCESNSQENAGALQTFSPNTTYSTSEPPLTPVTPSYSPVNYSPLPYSALHPAVPQNMPHVEPRLFLPPYLPYPQIPPMNIFPAVLTQASHLLPQHISSPQSPFLNLPSITPHQPVNTTQKSKTQSRPRFLQVIETKQPG